MPSAAGRAAQPAFELFPAPVAAAVEVAEDAAVVGAAGRGVGAQIDGGLQGVAGGGIDVKGTQGVWRGAAGDVALEFILVVLAHGVRGLGERAGGGEADLLAESAEEGAGCGQAVDLDVDLHRPALSRFCASCRQSAQVSQDFPKLLSVA